MGLAFLEYLPEGRNYQYYRKNSVGSLLRASELDAEYISGAYAVHFPGMLLELTEEMRGACERLVEIAREKGILVSFDPNIRRELSAGAPRTGAPAVGGAPCGRSGAHIERGADDYG